jgi:hypothetical protein
VEPFYIRPRFEAASSDAASGAGKEAECRYTPLAWENERPNLFYQNHLSLIAGFHLLIWDFLSARPNGLARREGPSGALESAQAVSRARARKGRRVSSEA